MQEMNGGLQAQLKHKISWSINFAACLGGFETTAQLSNGCKC